MKTHNALPLTLAALAGALALTPACRFGSADFASTFDERSFEPGGTVFSYLDARDDNLVEDADPRVVIAATWLIFDPRGDLNDLDGSALDSLSHELALRDALSLTFDHQGAVDAGENFESVVEANVEQGTGPMSARIHLAPERLNASSTYGDLQPFASRRTTTVELEEASFDKDEPVIAGKVSIEFSAVDGVDPGSAREGTFTGTFRAPLVQERVAESNLAALDADDEMNLPLPARTAQ